MYKEIASNKQKTALLIALFIIVIILLGYGITAVWDTGPGVIVFAAGFSVLMALGGYYGGDKVALLTAGAKGPVNRDTQPYLVRMVENLSITAGLPQPKIYLITDPAINAFATGRDPKHASIAVTTGAIAQLQNEELEGVLAHELSHVKNYDIRLSTVVIVLIGIIALISDWFLRTSFWGRGRRTNDREGGQVQVILMVVGIVLLILAPLIGKLIQLAISRKREFLADASGALLTRYPDGLANALEKIQHQQLPLQHATTATAHLYLANPFGNTRQRVVSLFTTHPPIDQRIKILRAMA